MLKRKGFIWGLVIIGFGLVLFFAWYLPAQIYKSERQKKYDSRYQEYYQQYRELQKLFKSSNR